MCTSPSYATSASNSARRDRGERNHEREERSRANSETQPRERNHRAMSARAKKPAAATVFVRGQAGGIA